MSPSADEPGPAKTKGLVRERMLHLILADPSGGMSPYELAKKAGCTPQWAYEFVDRLEEAGLTAGTSRTRVEDLDGLYDHWLDVHIEPARRDYHVPDVEAFLRSQERPTGTVGALTTYAAESWRQGFLFPARWDLYVDSEQADVWQRAILRAGGSRGGGSLRLLFHDDYLLGPNPTWFSEPFSGETGESLRVMATPRLILDLRVEGGPCAEAAEMLLEKERGRLAAL